MLFFMDILRTLRRRLLIKRYSGKLMIGHDTNIEPCNLSLSGTGAMSIGDGVSVRKGVLLSVRGGILHIEDGCFFNHNSIVASHGKIRIGAQTIVGPNVCIYDHDHVFSKDGVEKHKFKCSEVVIGKGCWIGANAVILRGTTLGDSCVVGAGTVVKGNFKSGSVITNNRSCDVR